LTFKGQNAKILPMVLDEMASSCPINKGWRMRPRVQSHMGV
jgi:hypothetical protein